MLREQGGGAIVTGRPGNLPSMSKIFQDHKINTMKKVYLLFFMSVLFIFKINAQLVVFGDNYATGVAFVPFGGSTNDLSIDATQHHSGTASLKINVTTGYTGGAFVADAPKNLSAYNAVTFWAKESKAFLLDGVGLGNNAATTTYAVERNGVALTSDWVKYYIPIPVAAKLTAETGLFHFAEGSGEGAYTIWIDDIQYENVGGGIIGTPTASFATETVSKEVGSTFGANGVVSSWPVNAVNQQMQTAKAYFSWTSSNTAVATVDALGVGTALTAGTTNITGKLGAVNASGLLTVNVTAPVGPSIAAPTPPARNPADVISLFSGAYSNLANTDWYPNWGQATTYSEVSIAGDATKKYSSLNYQGVQFASAIDASGMTKLHIDLWTPDCTAFDVYPIVTGQPEQKVTLTPTLSGWNSFDIDLSSYTIPLTSIIQFKFVGTPAGGSTVFLDNIYFYRPGGTGGSEPTTAAPTPTKNAASVISLFSNAYTNVVVDTWSASWDAADVADVQIAGNDTKKYTSLNYSGIEFTSKTIDATTMDYYHVDIWTPDATTFGVKLVDFGANGVFGGGDDTESQLDFVPAKAGWVSYDLKLSDFTNLKARSHLAQMLFIGSNSTLYVDNVYFYNSLLPVNLTEFKVTQKSSTAVLQWTTASEQNNKGFAVERSTDAANWKQVAFVAGRNGSSINNYSATDFTPAAGVNYYRLRQVDFDGRTTYYSPTRSLNFAVANTDVLDVFPNPARAKVSVALGAIQAASAHYYVVSADGKVVKSGSFDKALSNTVQSLDVSSLMKGLYIIKLSDGAKQQSAKLVIE